MQHFNFWTGSATVLIAALLLFWLFAPTTWVSSQLLFLGTLFQNAVAAVKRWFNKS